MGYRSCKKRTLIGVCLSGILLVALKNVVVKAQEGNAPKQEDTYNWNNREPDERYKADVLVVVAHSDDEGGAAAYCARIIDQKKQVAIVWTHDTGQSLNGGLNRVGPEQSASLAAIREIEGERAAAVLAITNIWNLGASDTESQNPLESLEGNDHGQLLGRMVRLVRLTRPEVIITWIPDFLTGENHSDHQAAAILATEAFDLAGDPTAFAEQVSPAREPGKDMNRTEGLRPWQPQKLYFFGGGVQAAGKGPEYNTTEISPSRNVSYGEIAWMSRSMHRTQMNPNMRPPGGAQPGRGQQAGAQPGSFQGRGTRFILGKSLVGGSPTDDVLAGVAPDGIPYQRPPGYVAPKHTEPVMEIGDPWHFYQLFWQAHGLDSLIGLVPYELSLTAGTTLSIPLIVDNPLDTPIEVSLSVRAPDGWKVLPVAPAHIAAHNPRYYLRVQAVAPPEVVQGWQEFTVTAESGGKTIGTVPLRVQLTRYSFPQ
jgi:LmbE family N-acetylglucosaminyl deacetylase